MNHWQPLLFVFECEKKERERERAVQGFLQSLLPLASEQRKREEEERKERRKREKGMETESRRSIHRYKHS